jgi:hypothetical protein
VINKIIIVIGPKGSGKSYTVARAVEKMERVVIFDTIHEREGYGDIEGMEIITGKPRDLYRRLSPFNDRKPFKIAYRPVEIELLPTGLINSPEFGPIVELCHLKGDMWLVIDEAHLLTNSRNCPPELMSANLLGRHRRVSLVFVAQSFTGIHPAIRKNADEFMFWRIIEPSDLEGIRERCGRDVEDKVRELRILERDANEVLIAPGQMLRWDKSRGIVEVTE